MAQSSKWVAGAITLKSFDIAAPETNLSKGAKRIKEEYQKGMP